MEPSPGQVLVGQVFMPSVLEPVPAVLFCHGLSSHKETFAPLAWELARRGIAGVVFDFGGYGQSYRRPVSPQANLSDAKALVQWMQQQPRLDAKRLGIVGHSMGGTTALEMGLAHPELKATVVLGIAGFATRQSPANLLFGSGVYEQLNPVGQMQEFAAIAAGLPPGQKLEAGTTLGSFALGTARRLALSPTIDHALAPYDGQLQREAIAWLEQAFNQPLSTLPLAGARLPGRVMAGVGAAGLASLAYGRWALWGGWPLRLGVGLGLLGLLLWGQSIAGAGVALAGLPVYLLGNHTAGAKKQAEQRAEQRAEHTLRLASPRQILLYGGVMVSLFVLAIALNAAVTGSLSAMPEAIWSLPKLVLNLLIGLPYHGFHRLRYDLDSLPGTILLGSIFLLETWRPGQGLRALQALGQGLLGWIRQPVNWDWQQTSWQSWTLVPLLLALLAGVWVVQFRAGALGTEAGLFVLRLFGLFLLLPGSLGVALVRSRWFQRLEQWLGEQ
ncbi:MAG: alpha/beta hydrolase [Synechococcales cyanobacterium RM1_1_8]|nr:alpha/beta hydrolase [Synechococcales cyanobacterium RM1_1_8]